MTPRSTLVICDGLGLSPEVNGNAFVNAPTPTFDYLLQNYPAMGLLAAGPEVGLDAGEPGNSEVGHLAIGTGQVLPQAFQLINAAIKSGTFDANAVILGQLAAVEKRGGCLHLVGLISKGGVHGHLSHLLALLDLARVNGVNRVVVHAITDGRDTPPRVALDDLPAIEQALIDLPDGRVGSVLGRYWAMDRDTNWDRTDAAIAAITDQSALRASSTREAITAAYGRGETDETLRPTRIGASPPLAAGDAVMMTNYRPDRARQLATRLFGLPFPLGIVTLTDYFLRDRPVVGHIETTIASAFVFPRTTGTLADALASSGKNQLHIAETEKYAHVTYFFDGHCETKHVGESWLLIPSLKISSFDRQPTMAAPAIGRSYRDAQTNTPPDFSVVNFANADMVGHTGNFSATKRAIEAIDRELTAIVNLAEASGQWLFVTADHGNAEQMIYLATGKVNKEHTTNPVPLICVHPTLKRPRQATKIGLASLGHIGMLADIAPTILTVLNVPVPPEMVGSNVLTNTAVV